MNDMFVCHECVDVVSHFANRTKEEVFARILVQIVPWCKAAQANVSLSLLRKFSLSVLEMQQSPGAHEQKKN